MNGGSAVVEGACAVVEGAGAIDGRGAGSTDVEVALSSSAVPGREHGRGDQEEPLAAAATSDRPPARRDLDVAHLGAPLLPRVEVAEKVENRNGLVARLGLRHSTGQVW